MMFEMITTILTLLNKTQGHFSTKEGNEDY